MDWLLGPLSRLICLGIVCAGWVPLVVLAYVRWRLKGSHDVAKKTRI